MEKLVIAGREFNSRLFLGTGKFNSNLVMEQAILASGTEMVTVAMKRIDMDNKEDDMLKHIIHPIIQPLPNTSGVRHAEEAVFAAQLAREAYRTGRYPGSRRCGYRCTQSCCRGNGTGSFRCIS